MNLYQPYVNRLKPQRLPPEFVKIPYYLPKDFSSFVDNQVRFRYQNSYWFRIVDASICFAADDAGKQFTIWDSSALAKQHLIFLCRYGSCLISFGSLIYTYII